MREMKDSGVEWIGEIPQHWKLERLQWHVTEIKESNKPEKTRQVLSLTNKRGVIPYEEKGAQGNIAKADYSQYKLAYPETIVANSMNILIGSVGRCNYFGCVSPVYYVYKPNDGENLEFINYMFQMEQFQKELRRYANGILEIRLRVSSDGILKRYMAFPPLADQARIVACLNKKCAKVDALISNVQAQIEKLKAYKQSLITEVVTKGLDPTVPMKDSGVEWIGDVPLNWNLTSIGRMCFVTKLAGFEYTSEMNGNITPIGDVPIVKAQNVKMGKFIEPVDNYISFEISKKLDRCALDKKSLLITFIGAGIGEVAIFDRDCRYHLAPNVAKIVIYDSMKSWIREEYLLYFIMSSSGQEEVNKIKKATAQPSLSMQTIRSIAIVIPPVEEQLQIADYLDKKCAQIDRLIGIKQEKITKLEQYKRSLIYEYVTGKKEVRL